jgi:N6-L-threonylcarbamoyladenine synthase
MIIICLILTNPLNKTRPKNDLNNMIILGIETSCDETAVSVIEANQKISVLSSIVSSQVQLHSKWGGVVPNLAAREHLKNILPVIEASLKKAGIKSSEITLLAVTNGPGLIPALLIGTNAAKTLSYVWKKPLLGIHHIEGHIYANFIENKISVNLKSQISNLKQTLKNNPPADGQKPKTKFPILCLVVSGGHTQIVLMKNHLKYKIIGQTLDDAAGEAFDKVARILGLGYPGGPIISTKADEYKLKAKNQKPKTKLPRPMLNSKNFDFSFSGLKTAVLYAVKKNPKILKSKNSVSALCYEFQQAVIDVLIAKTLTATQKYQPKTIMLAGGVSANKALRNQLGTAIKTNFPSICYRIPALDYSIDNAAMIATAGFFRWQSQTVKQRQNASNNWSKIKTDANLKLN